MKAALLSILVCLLHWVALAADCIPTPPGALGLWKFSNSSENSISAMPGTLKDNAHFEPGYVGQGLVLDGAIDRIDLGNPESLHVQDFTIECWVKRASLNAASISFPPDGAILSGSSGAYAITIAGNGTLFLGHVGIVSLYSSARVNDLEWHHIAVSKQGALVRFYLDGAFVDEHTFNVQFTFTGPFAIGGLGSDFGGQYFSFLGSIDTLAIYNRPLSDSEIRSIYKAGAVERCSTRNKLVWTSKTGLPVQGSPVDASLEIQNLGSTTQSNLTAQIQVPEDASILSATTADGSCTVTGTIASCTLSALAPESNAHIDIRFVPQHIGANSIRAMLFSANAGSAIQLYSSDLGFDVKSSCSGLSGGLVSWWKAEGNTTDQLGVTEATTVGAVQFEKGVAGQAFKLDGHSFIQLTSPTQYHISNFTIETWIKRGDLSRASYAAFPDAAIFSGGDRSYGLSLGADGTPFLTHVGVVSMRATRRIQDMDWHHVAVTKSGRTLKFYLDGTEAGSATFDGEYVFSTPFAIGALGAPFAGESYAFIGSIDEPALFNTALTLEEIRAIYDSRGLGKCQDDIALAFSSVPGVVQKGSTNSFRLVASNFGIKPASNSVVIWPLKPGQSFVRSSLPEAACTVNNSTVRCELGTLPAQSSLQLEFQIQFATPGEFNHEVGISRAEPDALLGNNIARGLTIVIDSCLPPLPGLISRWSGEGNSWDTIGSAHALFPKASFGPGVNSGQAFSLDGTSTLPVGDFPSHRPPRFTWSMWVNPTSYTGNFEILMTHEKASGIGTHSRLAILGIGGPLYPAGSVLFNVGVPDWPNDPTAWLVAPSVIPLGEWTHVALTYDTNGTAAVYVNGSMVREIKLAPQPAPSFGVQPGILTLGGAGPKSPISDPANRFNGSLDEIALYDRPLSAAEVAVLAQAKTSLLCRKDLAVLWIEPPTSLSLGDSQSLSLAVRNSGADTVTTPSVRITTSEGLPILRATAGGTACVINNGVAECSLSDLSAGAETIVRMFVRADGKPGRKTLNALVSSNSPEDSPRNNEAVLSIETLGSCQPVENLVAWWKFEDSLDERAQGLIEGSNILGVYTAGRVGRALQLGNGFISIATPLPGLPTDRLSVEAWIQRLDTSKSSPNDDFGVLIGAGNGAWNFSLSADGRLLFGITDISRVESKPVITDLAWHHVVATVGNETVTLFVDGEPVFSNAYPFTFQYPDPFTVGNVIRSNNSAGSALLANLDELKVYSEALAPERIRQNFANANMDRCFEDLAIKVDPQADIVDAGASFRLSFDVANRGTSVAPHARLRMEVPEGYTLGEVTNPGGACSLSNGFLVCALGNLVPGARMQIDLELGTNPLATELKLLPTVISDLSDSVPNNSRASVQLTVLGPCVAPPQGLVAWWRGEGDLSDFVGSNPTAITQGGPPSFPQGQVGRSFLFDGGKGIGVTGTNSLASTSFSIAAWVRPTKLDGTVEIIAAHELLNAPQSPTFALGIRGPRLPGNGKIQEGQLCFQVGNVSGLTQDFGKWIDARASIPLNTWSFVALTIDPDLHSVAASVDGIETRRMEFLSGTPGSASGGFYIGSHSPRAIQISFDYVFDRFTGGIDEVMLFQRALQRAEIQAIYSAGKQGLCPSDLAVKLVSPFAGPVPLGQVFPIDLQVTNSSSREATGVVITNTLPSFFQFLTFTSPSPDARTTVRDGKLVTEFTSIAPASIVSARYFVKASPGTDGRWNASLSSQSLDLNPSNNSFTQTFSTAPLELVIAGNSPSDGPNENLGMLEFVVHLSIISSTAITVDYTTKSGSAIEGVDFIRTTGTLTLAPGQSQASILVALINDGIPEDTESFTVTLSNAQGATIGSDTATGYIVSEPTRPALSIDNVTLLEGTTTANTATFTVSLTPPSRNSVTVQYSTANGTARAGVDFVATEGTLTFAPGETRKEIAVRTVADSVPEPNEQFMVLLRNSSGAPIDDPTGVASLLNDDGLAGQLAGFECEIVSQPTVPDGKTRIRIAARDISGNPLPGYSGVVSISAHFGSGNPVGILLTEIFSDPSGNVLEFQNVGGTTADISGWTLTLFDADRWPAPQVSFTFPTDTRINPKEPLLVSDRATPLIDGVKSFRLGSPVRWTTFLLEETPRKIGVLLQDDVGRVRDAFFADGAKASEISVPLQLTPSDWNGAPVPRAIWSQATYSRKGRSQDSSARSWVWVPPSIGTQNSQLALPFAEGLPLTVAPELASAFVNGVYQGQIQVTPPATGFRIFVDDGNGHTGVSLPVTVPITGDIALELQSPATVTVGKPVEFVARIRNPGPTIAGPLSVSVKVMGNILSTGFVGSNSHGAPPTIDGSPNNWVVTASVNEVRPGTTAEVRFFMATEEFATGVIQAFAQISKAPSDPNELNNSAESNTELSRIYYHTAGRATAWWPATDKARDLAGQHHGSLVGAIQTVPGRVGPGFQFAAPDAALIVPNAADLNLSPRTSVSIEFWIRSDAADTGRKVHVFSKRDPTTGGGYSMTLNSGIPEFTLYSALPGSQPVVAHGSNSRALNDGRWHYFAISMDRSKPTGRMVVMVDGVGDGSVSAQPLADLSNDSPLRFGASPNEALESSFIGELDEIIVWAGDLQNEVDSVFKAGGNGRFLNTVGAQLVAPLTSGAAGSELPDGVQNQPYPLYFDVRNYGPYTAYGLRMQLRFTVAPSLLIIDAGPSGSSRALLPTLWEIALPSIAPGDAAPISLKLSSQSMEQSIQVSLSSDLPNQSLMQPKEYHVRFNPDTDGDGMDDDYEFAHGLDPINPADGALDADHDGASNASEFQAGTSPIDPSSYLELEAFHSENGGIDLEWVAQPNRFYQVVRKSVLGGTDWEVIAEHIGGEIQRLRAHDTLQPDGSAWYTIRVLR